MCERCCLAVCTARECPGWSTEPNHRILLGSQCTPDGAGRRTRLHKCGHIEDRGTRGRGVALGAQKWSRNDLCCRVTPCADSAYAIARGREAKPWERFSAKLEAGDGRCSLLALHTFGRSPESPGRLRRCLGPGTKHSGSRCCWLLLLVDFVASFGLHRSFVHARLSISKAVRRFRDLMLHFLKLHGCKAEAVTGLNTLRTLGLGSNSGLTCLRRFSRPQAIWCFALRLSDKVAPKSSRKKATSSIIPDWCFLSSHSACFDAPDARAAT